MSAYIDSEDAGRRHGHRQVRPAEPPLRVRPGVPARRHPSHRRHAGRLTDRPRRRERHIAAGAFALHSKPVGRLTSHLDPLSATYQRGEERMRALCEELQARLARGARGRRDERARASPRARQAARPRAHRPAARPRHRVARALAARGLRPLRRRGARRRDRDGHRHRARPRVRDRRQRRDRQGRHVLPADGQEAPAGTGDRAREPPALHLPGGLGRGVPAAAGRGLPRPRPLRPHLLQPGAHVGRRHSAARRGDGLVHGRRRLRAGDVRPERDRAGNGHDLPRRAAAREGRDRRGGDGRGTRRRRRARAHLGRRRRARELGRARARAAAGGGGGARGSGSTLARAARARAAGLRPRRARWASSRRTSARRSTCAR